MLGLPSLCAVVSGSDTQKSKTGMCPPFLNFYLRSEIKSMACYSPLTAYRLVMPVGLVKNGRNRPLAERLPKVVFNVPAGCAPLYTEIRLPCGQCSGCRTTRAQQWAVRCVHESKLWTKNSFITLTFRPDSVPADMSLDVRYFQLFMKRLRKHFKHKIRFYHCGEYGPKNGRPHYHAILFNCDFPDRVYWKTTPAGETLYRSPTLEKLWPYGYSSVGDVTIQSAFYVAQYCQDKLNVSDASPEAMVKAYNDKYDWAMPDGEIISRKPEYSTMSRRSGIGNGAFKKWSDDWFNNDFIISNGTRVPIPRYYDSLYEHDYPDLMHKIKLVRVDNAKKFIDDNTTERLIVRKTVAEAQRKLYRKDV